MLVAPIAPYADSRCEVAERYASLGTAFFEMQLATPVEVCEQWEVKGLYARQAAVQLKGLTGIDDP